MAETINDLIGGIADKLGQNSDSQPLFGETVVIDGVSVVPVYKVSAGFGGGGFNTGKNGAQLAGGAGAGTTKTPVAYISVSGGKVRVTSAEEPKGSVVADVAAALFETIKNKKKKAK